MPTTRELAIFAILLSTGVQGCRPAAVAVREQLFLSEEAVAIEVIYEHPVDLPRVAAVVLHGGFSPDQTPASSEYLLREDAGLIQIHVDLPGGEGNPTTPGEMDHYGAQSRRAVAAALRYAASELADDAGLTVGERIEMDSSLPVVLVGRSNGGNLATATLADPELDLPIVSGLVLWETPAGPQFLLNEISEPELQECGFSAEANPGLVCQVNLEHLVDGEPPFLDRNSNGELDAAEPAYAGLELGELRIHSPTLLQALPPNPNRMTENEALDWFEWRDAGRCSPGAVDLNPHLAVILLGSVEDHAQTISGSPHVIGLSQLFSRANAWTRLLPDSAYSELSVEQPAGVGLSLDDPGALAPSPTWLTGLISAAVMELGDRTLNNDWEPDLQQSLRDSG